MPTKYSVSCYLDQRWVAEWGGDKSPMRFCFGSTVEGGQVNVVAYADVIGGSITCEWEEDYFIAASRKSHNSGTVITSATDWAGIDFGMKYVVNRTWTNPTPTSSPKAPDDGFFFQNLNTAAAAVVAKRVNGKISPFYISPVLLPPAGKEGGDTLIPTPTVAVWFQMDVTTGSMIDAEATQKYFIKMRGPTAKAYFDYDGNWSATPPNNEED